MTTDTSNVRTLPAHTEHEKGMLVHVLRAAHHSTDGPTVSFDKFVLVGEQVPSHARIFASGPEYPALRIVRREIGGEPYFHAEPCDPPPSGHTGWMAGGNYIHTSDGRWRDIVGHSLPIPVHDRSEAPLNVGGM